MILIIKMIIHAETKYDYIKRITLYKLYIQFPCKQIVKHLQYNFRFTYHKKMYTWLKKQQKKQLNILLDFKFMTLTSASKTVNILSTQFPLSF